LRFLAFWRQTDKRTNDLREAAVSLSRTAA